MNKKHLLIALSFASIGLFTSCEKTPQPDNKGGNGDETYVVAAKGAEAVYLLQTDNINEGTLSTQNASIEVESGDYWLFPKNKYAYRLVYAQGNAGTGSSYRLNADGEVEEREIAFSITDRFTTFGIYGDYIICAASGATSNYDPSDTDRSYPKYGVTFTYLDVENQTKQTATVITEDLLGNGERYTLSGIVQSSGKFYSALCSEGYSPYGVWKNHDAIVANLQAAGEDVATTITTTEAGLYSSIASSMFPNEVVVAIYNGTDFANPTIIRDSRLSAATSRYRSQFYSNIDVADNGDVYVFSSNVAGAKAGIYKSDKTSGVIRIKAGSEAFDQDYFADITALSGGHSLYKVWYISDNNFLLQMFADQGYFTSGYNVNTNRLAIFNAVTKAFTWVTGMPADNTISSLGNSPYFENGIAYMPVVFSAGSEGGIAATPAVYNINAATATATKGLTINADNGVTAIGKLKN